MRHLIAVLVSTTIFIISPLAAAGDINAGKEIAVSKGCAGCHGIDGNSVNANWPKLAGQNAKYLAKMLRVFRSNDSETYGRINPIMAGTAKDLTDEDIANLAAYFASQKAKTGEADPELVDLGYHIYRGGDKDKGIPSCMGCHGPTGAGNPASSYPALAGQWAIYTEAQLLYFKSDSRRTDPNQMMRNITSKMNREEIKAVASYIQGLYD